MVALATKWESVASAVLVLQNFLGSSVVTEIYACLVHVRMVEHVQCKETIMSVAVHQDLQAESVVRLLFLPVIQPPARMEEPALMICVRIMTPA